MVAGLEGESPTPGPRWREPDIEEARARSLEYQAHGSGTDESRARSGSREGASGGSHRCVNISSESEAP